MTLNGAFGLTFPAARSHSARSHGSTTVGKGMSCVRENSKLKWPGTAALPCVDWPSFLWYPTGCGPGPVSRRGVIADRAGVYRLIR